MGANAAIYLVLSYQLIHGRMARTRRAENLREAFGVLGEEVKKWVPSLPPGYTWREVAAELRRKGLKIDWASFSKSMNAYEALRYGDSESGVADYREVLRLARELRRIR